jgi:Ferredoxin-like domain in Api92-like protein
MPNHCTNYLTVTGDDKEIMRFHDAIIKGEIQEHEQFRILDNLFPTPENLKNTPSGSFASDEQKTVDEKNKSNIAKFGYKDWYDWNCANYGSKWSDFDGVINTYEAGLLDVVFVSAWSPIIQGMVHVSKEFPTLNFILTYEEGGMAFLGGAGIKNGEIVGEIEGEYPSMSGEDDEDYDAHYEKVSEVVGGIAKELETVF